MKRILSILSVLLLLLGLTSCRAPATSKTRILCTLAPHYDWTYEILGDEAERFDLCLLGNGADLHSYEPSAMDIMEIGSSALLIYNGGSSEEWVEQAIDEAPKAERSILKLYEHQKLLPLPHEHTQEEHHHEYDEHTWLSLKNAQAAVEAIAEAICTLDAANAEIYRANAKDYIEKLQALDRRYQQMADTSKRRTFLLADRYPFRYLAEDYGLTCYAAFDGCSAETEAGAATISSLAKAMDENNLPAVIILEGSELGLAETIIESTQKKDQMILKMDPMQTTGGARQNYLTTMENNLEALETALNEGE